MSLNSLEIAELEELSLGDLLSTLLRYKRSLLRNALIAAVIAIPVVFILPVKYRAESIILTPQQPQSSLSAMAQLTGLGAGIAPFSLLTGLGIRNPADLYVGILKSRTIADAVIAKFNLTDVYGDKYVSNARKHLARNTTIEASKDSLIHIRVDDVDPKRAAEIANSYVDELFKQNARLALAESSQRREFFEHELIKEKDALADAEVALKNTEQATGLVVPGGQAEALIRSGAQLRAEILSREAQLEGMKAYAADTNPKIQIVQHELSALRSELSKIEKGSTQSGVLELPTGRLPEAGLQYLRKFRDVKYHETLFEILSRQYEAARLDEAKSAPQLQMVDIAVVPDRRHWPPRTVLILSAVLSTVFVSGFYYLHRNRL